MVGGGTFHLRAGEWTDDTSMMLAFGDALKRRGYDPVALMDAMLAWTDKGEYSHNGRCFDIGSGTRHTMAKYRLTGKPMLGKDEGGNACLMRVPAFVLYWDRDRTRAVDFSCSQARLTHGNREALEATRTLANILWELVDCGESATLDEHPAGTWKREEIDSGGFAPRTLEAAIWAVRQTDTFRDAVLLAANLGRGRGLRGGGCRRHRRRQVRCA
ncbi:MAG: ADP-ribosylglycohydrolase [Rhodospirillaceae bacterium]|nr:MAG: ADP-ribosylglycohydrolase [Rhodospirillaceae bacterium]